MWNRLFSKQPTDLEISLDKFIRKYPWYQHLCREIATFVQCDLLMDFVIGPKMGSHLEEDSVEYHVIKGIKDTKTIGTFNDSSRFDLDDIRFNKFGDIYSQNLHPVCRKVYLDLLDPETQHQAQKPLKNLLFDVVLETCLKEAGFSDHQIRILSTIYIPHKLNLLLKYNPSEGSMDMWITTKGDYLLWKYVKIHLGSII